MKSVMVDLETTGLKPEHSGIMQIAAVKFDLATGEIDANFFDECLYLPNNRYWQEETRGWWSKMPDVLRQIFFRMREPRAVLNEFVEWLGPDQYMFWAKPTHFDYSFLASYFADFEIRNPFHYRETMDMNTWIRSRYFPNDVDNLFIPFDGDVHNALMDALNQIKTLMAHYDNTKKH